MTVDQCLAMFQNIDVIRSKLQTLVDVGLGYVPIGQSATTLSGGEAQRIKLARELSKRGTGKHPLYSGRTHHRTASRRHPQTAGGAEPPGGCGQYGGGDRAQSGCDQNRRLCHRFRPRRR